MSREKAKEILYKHEEKSSGAITHWQANWILDAMEEYSKLVKSNSVLGGVSNCIHCGEDVSKHSEYAKICPNEFNCFERNDC